MIGSPTTPVMMIPAMTEIANHADTPWPSLQTASWLFDKASWVLAASLLIGAICTVLIVWMGTVKEHHWDLAREIAGNKIGNLEVRAAELNRQAEADRLARMQIEERIKPRVLSEAQQSLISQRMTEWALLPSGSKQSVAVFAYPMNLDNGRLADQIASALAKAGWNINRYPVTMGFDISAVAGVGLLTTTTARSEKIGDELVSSLRECGIAAGKFDLKIERLKDQPENEDDTNPAFSHISVFVGDRP